MKLSYKIFIFCMAIFMPLFGNTLPNDTTNQADTNLSIIEKIRQNMNSTSGFYANLYIDNIYENEIFFKRQNNKIVILKEDLLEIISRVDSIKKNSYTIPNTKLIPLDKLDEIGIFYNFNRMLNTIKVETKPQVRSLKKHLITQDLYRHNKVINTHQTSGKLNTYTSINKSSSKDTTYKLRTSLQVNYKNYIVQTGVNLDKNTISRGNVWVEHKSSLDSPRYRFGEINSFGVKTDSIRGVSVEVSEKRRNEDVTKKEDEKSFFLENDSTVEVIVNNHIAKKLKLRAGTHQLSNISLYTGVNRIKLKITDIYGKISYLNFSSKVNFSNVLRKGQLNYGISVGKITNIKNKHYDKMNLSAYLENYVTDNISLKQKISSQDGDISYKINTPMGFEYGTINPTYTKKEEEEIFTLNYHYNISKDLSLELNYDKIKYLLLGSYANKVKKTININTKIFKDTTATFNYNTTTQYKNTQENFKIGLSGKLSRKLSWGMEIGREKYNDELKIENNVISGYLSYNFSKASVTYSKKYYAHKRTRDEDKVRVGYRYNNDYYNSFEVQTTNTNVTRRANLDISKQKYYINTHITQTKYKSDTPTSTSTSINAGFGVAFVGNNYVMSRSISDSFIIVKHKDTKLPPIDTKNHKNKNKAHSFVINSSNFYNNKIKFDRQNLPFNLLLESKDKYNIQTGYKTGHLIIIDIKKHFLVTGTLYQNGKLVRNTILNFQKIGSKKIITSFTNSRGKFYATGLTKGKYKCSFLNTKYTQTVFEVLINKTKAIALQSGSEDDEVDMINIARIDTYSDDFMFSKQYKENKKELASSFEKMKKFSYNAN